MSMIEDYQDLDSELLTRYKSLVKTKREKIFIAIKAKFIFYISVLYLLFRISKTFYFYFIGCKLSSSPCTIHRDVRYSKERPRNIMDIYQPLKTKSGGNPVVVFIHGGSWMYGVKTLHIKLGRSLASQGITTVLANYSLYPNFSGDQQVEEIGQILEYVSNHIESYGGDTRNITLMGHSAGGHLITQYLLTIYNKNTNIRERINIKNCIPMSAPLDMREQFIFQTQLGKEHTSMIVPYCGGVKGLNYKSPLYWISLEKDKSLELPSIYLIYGDQDNLVPPIVNSRFLHQLEKKCKEHIHLQALEYDDVAHVDLITDIEDQENNVCNSEPFNEHRGAITRRHKKFMLGDILRIILN
ncbi:hypothetical protein PPL_04261 [Heterostelium album PN500]|uniref:BD-FAE-like domain-containing protein n=1 Tax=Heterostelium pallidum (strain ATCC 26659 / Pp 5 / PN500) TaxID=670386 RepID=D3B729_HETP5|nr:hypothetical protein PPL_04261 [Heterostelium album PN500]EFA82572.1 hypothetical protein PPL_04261 [Heterostelium album PN500]|eukprot:XP_020434689.1 hypothetical protein PPL_04261 [Heterostelium album PN500]